MKKQLGGLNYSWGVLTKEEAYGPAKSQAEEVLEEWNSKREEDPLKQSIQKDYKNLNIEDLHGDWFKPLREKYNLTNQQLLSIIQL